MGRKENKAVAIFCEKIITFGESPKCREILLSYFESLHHFGIRATPRLFSINNCAIPPTFHHPMPATRSGNSYNMSNPQVPNNPHIPNNPNREQPNLQQQVTQITTVLEQLTHRLDAMDERRAREGRRSPNRRRRGPPPEESLDESDREEEEDLEDEEHREFEARRPRFQHYRGDPRNRGRRGTGYQPLDELTKRMKVDVPDFHGKLEPNAFEDWLTAIEDYFDWFTVSEDRKVRYVRMKLKGHARAWWESVEAQLRRTRRPSISNWEEMKEQLKEKYLPIDYEQMMFEEMLQLRQGALTVGQYTDRFHELTVRSRIVETEQQTLARYRNGLRRELYKEMLIAHQSMWTRHIN